MTISEIVSEWATELETRLPPSKSQILSELSHDPVTSRLSFCINDIAVTAHNYDSPYHREYRKKGRQGRL